MRVGKGRDSPENGLEAHLCRHHKSVASIDRLIPSHHRRNPHETRTTPSCPPVQQAAGEVAEARRRLVLPVPDVHCHVLRKAPLQHRICRRMVMCGWASQIFHSYSHKLVGRITQDKLDLPALHLSSSPRRIPLTQNGEQSNHNVELPPFPTRHAGCWTDLPFVPAPPSDSGRASSTTTDTRLVVM